MDTIRERAYEKVPIFSGNSFGIQAADSGFSPGRTWRHPCRIRKQEEHIEALEAEYRHLSQEFNRRKAEGISILDALKYEQYLRAMERQIEEAHQLLQDLQKQEEAKRKEVVEAKKDTSSIEKLREKKLEVYNKAVQKSEENLIDEFVTTKRIMEAQSA